MTLGGAGAILGLGPAAPGTMTPRTIFLLAAPSGIAMPFEPIELS
jgi:hypothetical protein